MGFIGPDSFNTNPEGLSPQTALHTFMPYNLAYSRLFFSDYETTSLGGSSITVVLCQPFWTEKNQESLKNYTGALPPQGLSMLVVNYTGPGHRLRHWRVFHIYSVGYHHVFD